MYEKYPISGIKQSYRHTRESPTVVMPILIGMMFVALVVFFVKSKPEPIPAPQRVVSNQEEAASPAAGAIEETSPLPLKSEEQKAASPSEEPAAPSSDPAETESGGLRTVSSPVEETGSFTAWMTPLALDTYIRLKNEGYSESFWQRGHWITAVEGRWENGSQEFRIALDKIPDLNRWQWQYRVNQSSEDFVNASTEFAEQGFELVHTQTFKDPDGSTKFQAVWQRELPEAPPVVEASTPTPTAPAPAQAVETYPPAPPTTDSLQVLNVNNLRFR